MALLSSVRQSIRDLALAADIIIESRAICRYLALKYKGQGTKLIPDPEDVKANALFEQWASVELTNYEHYSSVIVMQNLFTKLVFHLVLLCCIYSYAIQGSR